MPFQYQPFVNPYGASIGELLAHRNDASAHAAEVIGQAQAHAQEVTGQAFGNAAATAGQAIGGAIQQATDPRRQIELAQLDELKQRKADLLSLDNAFTQPGGRDAILSALPGHLRPTVAKQLNEADESAAKVQETSLAAEKATGDYVNGLADKIAANGFDPSATQLAITHAKQTFQNNPSLLAQVNQFEQSLHANPTVDGVKAMVTPILQARDTAAINKARGEKFAPGEVSPVLGSVPPAGPKLEMVPEGGTALDPSTQRPVFTAQPKPKPLPDLYVEAVAKGDTAAANNILKAWKDEANAKRDPVAQAQLEAIRNLSQTEAQARIDDRDPTSPKNQQKFEQEYRTVLQRGLSSRSGGLGLEDAKVQQANHLMAIFEQNYDPKTGEWNIPRVQLNELALGLARLTAPGGQAGEGMLHEFQQRTAKGDLAGALTYITGQPVPANTQGLTQMLKDSIERQGKTAEQNREGEMNYLRGLAPTDLEEARRKKLEGTSLNPLRQSKVLVNPNGERRLVYSVDGGATWR